jgi:hypothetical protein
MGKYNIEGNIDFYGELYKMMDDNKEDENYNLDNKENNFCLISNTPLVEHFVKLTCGHKFNYIPLYKDILNHRKKFHNMERQSLRPHELRCPYCRSVQKGLLPFIPELGLDKEHGVNFIDTNIQNSVPSAKLIKCVNGKCHFGLCDTLQSQSQSHLQSQNMVISGSQNVVIDNLGMINDSLPVIDNSYNVIPICKNTQVVVLDLDKQTYCYEHLFIAKKNYLAKAKLELKQKMKYIQNLKKESLKKEKLEAKKQEKEKEKQAKLQEKLEQKQSKTKSVANVNVNTNVNENVSSNSNICIQILKTGKNKGIQCSCLVTKDNLCTRHYNLLNKNNNIVEK